jgi:hypothetical protein
MHYIPHTEETKRKMSASHKGKKRESLYSDLSLKIRLKEHPRKSCPEGHTYLKNHKLEEKYGKGCYICTIKKNNA